MIGYYRKRLTYGISKLRELENDSEDLDRLFQLQKYIILQVFHAEKKKSEHREKADNYRRLVRTARLSKEESAKQKKRMSFSKGRIESYRRLSYFWRCLGDGIAFTYVSKWNLKPLMYDDKSAEPKAHAGNLGGKTGLAAELAVVFAAIKHGVPAVLCDITNIVRHGDVCLLGGSDPHVIEVKASGELGARGEKQQARIDRIHKYLESDEGVDVRGAPYCMRVSMAIPEVNHSNEINLVISDALSNGFSKIAPEPGILYIAMAGKRPDYSKIFEGMKAPVVYMLNQAKSEMTWGSYYPFTLSIRSSDNLLAFLEGKVYVMVVLDWVKLGEVALSYGFSISHVEGGDFTLQIQDIHNPDEDTALIRLSGHFISRIAFEFVSWKWILEDHRANTNSGRYKELIANGLERFGQGSGVTVLPPIRT